LGFRVIGVLSRPLRRDGVTRVPRLLPWSGRWTAWRTPPAIDATPARSRADLHAARAPLAETRVTGRRVLLHLQCLADRVTPQTPVAAAALLRAAGAEVVIPAQQHCCGLPAIDAGDDDAAREMARDTLRAFSGVDDVVTPAPSCVVAMLHGYQELFADEPAWAERATQLTGRVHDLVSYLAGPARLPAGALAQGDASPVVVHRFCQSANFLGAGSQLEDLVSHLCDVEVSPLAEADTCCGFGGMTSLGNPELSAGILERKLSALADTGVRTVITANPGCVIHLRGGAHASGRPFDVQHVAEYLAGRLPHSSG
jgi:Fe-S oxidoreductase